MQSLPTFALEAFFATWEFKAKHHLTASDAQTMTVAELLDLAGPTAREDFLNLSLGYIPTWGTDELRAAIADTYRDVQADDVLTFAGAEEALFWVMQELLGPGDHAVVTVPNYQSLEAVPLATGAEVTGLPIWRQRPDGDAGSLEWSLDLEALTAALRPTTKVVAVNFPNNPTGFVPDRQSWAALAALCDERGIHLFNDEVYRGAEVDPARTLPAAVELSPRGISLDVTSKSMGLPGLRVGWVACRDRDLLARLEKRKHWTTICNAGPSEALALHAVRLAPQLRERTRALVEANLTLFDAFFGEHADLFDWAAPDGGCVAFPRYLGPEGADTFCAELVEATGVLLLPGSVYASQLLTVPTDRFRVGVGRENPEVALQLVAEFVAGRRPAATRPAGRRRA